MEPEYDVALTEHSVGSRPLISSVVTLIMHRIIALVLFDIDQEK